MLKSSDESLPEADFDLVNASEPPPCVGESVQHVLGGPEMLVVERSSDGSYEYATTRYRNPGASEDEQNVFFCGNLRRVLV